MRDDRVLADEQVERRRDRRRAAASDDAAVGARDLVALPLRGIAIAGGEVTARRWPNPSKRASPKENTPPSAPSR